MQDLKTHHAEATAAGRLMLRTGDGGRRELHPLWLRERCPCGDCRDARTGQRLLDSWALPLDTAIHSVRERDGRIEVTFPVSDVRVHGSEVPECPFYRHQTVAVVADQSLNELSRNRFELFHPV